MDRIIKSRYDVTYLFHVPHWEQDIDECFFYIVFNGTAKDEEKFWKSKLLSSLIIFFPYLKMAK